jgi:hypothetical protein
MLGRVQLQERELRVDDAAGVDLLVERHVVVVPLEAREQQDLAGVGDQGIAGHEAQVEQQD